MPMLPALEAAFLRAGKSKAQIARDCGVSVEGLRVWFNGGGLVPLHKRERLEAALGGPVDWIQACAQQKALKAPENPAPAPPPRPPIVRVAAKIAPEAPKPRAKAPQAPAPLPLPPKNKQEAPKRRFFGLIIDDSQEANP